MKGKRQWLPYVVTVAAAIIVGILFALLENSLYGEVKLPFVRLCSDGFFASAVIFLGLGMMSLIADAGVFYGLQYLGYVLVFTFSPRKDRFEGRKDYYTYCLEKQEKKKARKEQGEGAVKWALLIAGGTSLLVSVLCTVLFYYG